MVVANALPAGITGQPQGTTADYNDRLFTYYKDDQALIPSLIGTKEIDEMLDRDGKAKSLEGVLTLPLRGARWQLHPAPGDTGELAMCKELLDDDTLRLLISQMTSAQLYSKAYFEKTFEVTDDGLIGLKEIGFRPASTCELARKIDTGEFDGFWQWAWRGFAGVKHVQIPAERAFVYIHGTHRAPWSGTSELATAYSVFEAKAKIRFLWYKFLENYSMPRAIGTAGTDDAAAAADLAKRAAKLKGGGVIGLKQGETLAPYGTTAPGAEQYAAALNYLDGEMAGSVLAGFLELGASAGRGAGSLALSKDQTDFFLQSREAIAREMEVAVRSGILTQLCEINIGKNAAVPYLRAAPLSLLDSTTAVTLLQQLAVAPPGATSLPQVFIDLLIEQVAAYLGMDVDTVSAGITDAQDQAKQAQAAQLIAAVSAAHSMVAGAPSAGQPALPAGGGNTGPVPNADAATVNGAA